MPPKHRTLIVDDEAPARRVLTDYVARAPGLELAGACADGIAALAFLQRERVDLLLLDVNMPELSGLELLDALHRPPAVILTTAYSEYALESYEYAVADYLLKPISFPRFLKAVARVRGRRDEPAAAGTATDLRHLEVKVDGLVRRLPLEDLQYLKSFGNYLRLVTASRTYTLLGTLSGMETRLPPAFQRIHKSYLVNTAAVSGVIGNRVRIGKEALPLSPLYKLLLLEKLDARP